MIEVGKKYISQAGNVIKILERDRAEDSDGRPIFLYKGHIEKTVNGHEILRGKIHTFFEDGKWTARPNGVHDLGEAYAER